MSGYAAVSQCCALGRTLVSALAELAFSGWWQVAAAPQALFVLRASMRAAASPLFSTTLARGGCFYA